MRGPIRGLAPRDNGKAATTLDRDGPTAQEDLPVAIVTEQTPISLLLMQWADAQRMAKAARMRWITAAQERKDAEKDYSHLVLQVDGLRAEIERRIEEEPNGAG